ncbi:MULTISPECIES: tol-pal system-associated acyl-CoA thioesterase [Larsenimonas]|uniref:Tol-pal system-associated acyl-CoA thioesterase n=1 Tax=Larsenimonas suaedae TaxID=1851019 RepID=A0ABU1GYV0_9GAMM|nr:MULTISPECIES: tol-pal system-associated acyl-CoA thioesterase [Larsenimonas]MCM2971366.1 tol-pal system-associated acyl-CoA thioesterase [Larsenimonas suaedae]MCM5703473.1 tol-pal system-associated acyl-CoA thioesterase [Larsenimonas salina]MDR5896622.1 tol-pal system-associated acyl-CoA thioesterase [Larsenimonas suaedae]
MSSQIHVRVYIEDTDAGRIVYHARYLHYFERARTEWLRDLGLEQQGLLDQGVQLVVRSITCRFKRPARLDDVLSVSTTVLRHSSCSAVFEQRIECNGEHLCDAEVDIACIDAHRQRPMRWPSVFNAAFTNDH